MATDRRDFLKQVASAAAVGQAARGAQAGQRASSGARPDGRVSFPREFQGEALLGDDEFDPTVPHTSMLCHPDPTAPRFDVVAPETSDLRRNRPPPSTKTRSTPPFDVDFRRISAWPEPELWLTSALIQIVDVPEIVL